MLLEMADFEGRIAPQTINLFGQMGGTGFDLRLKDLFLTMLFHGRDMMRPASIHP